MDFFTRKAKNVFIKTAQIL
jgi:hypothetical protein